MTAFSGNFVEKGLIIEDLGWKPRITGYTPLHNLSKLTEKELEQLIPKLNYWDRKSLYLDGGKVSQKLFYQKILGYKEVRY